MSKNSLRDKLDGDELDLSMMSLTEIPVKEIAALPRATKIDLSSNQLTTIPPAFAQTLTKITRLELGSNKIRELPENFCKLTNLRHLDLYNNQLTKLPLSFSELPNLKWLDLKGNPLNAALHKVAGDCLNQRECENAAKRVVQHLKKLQDDMEEAKQEKLRKQKEREEARAKAAEAKLAKERAKKKEAKEKRKAELRAQYEAEKTQLNGTTNQEKHYIAEAKTATKTEQKSQGKSGGWSVLGWINMLLFVILLGAAASGLYVYTDGDLSVDGITTAFPRIVENTEYLAHLTYDAFQPANLMKTTDSVAQTVSRTTTKIFQSLEYYTGDLSAYTKPVSDNLVTAFVWLKVHAFLSYDWITNNVDWKSILEAIKAAALFLYEQFLVACEELSRNEALMSLLATLRAYTSNFTDSIAHLFELAWGYVLVAVTYIQEEGPGYLEAAKENAAGALHTIKQSVQGLVK